MTAKQKALHITNGVLAVELMRAGGIAGEILPWCDLMGGKPVQAGKNLNIEWKVTETVLLGLFIESMAQG